MMILRGRQLLLRRAILNKREALKRAGILISLLVVLIGAYCHYCSICYDKFGEYICFQEIEERLSPEQVQRIEKSVEVDRNTSLARRLFYLKKSKWTEYCFEKVVNTSLLQDNPSIPYSDCSAPYVTIDDDGRLGNRVCQYYSVLIFRKHFGMRVIISSKMLTNLLQLTSSVIVPTGEDDCFPYNKSSQVTDTFYKIYQNLYHNIHHLKKGLLQDVPIGHMNYMVTFPSCSADFFASSREYFRDALRIKGELVITAQNRLDTMLKEQNISRKNVTLVSVHVRRTDIMADTRVFLHTKVPGEVYYRKAFALYRKKFGSVLFVLLSDDLTWCQRILSGPDVVFPGTGVVSDPALDFVIVTLCDHHIVGLGTFAYTSAFMGTGTIAYPIWKEGAEDPLMSKLMCNDPESYIPVAF